LAGGARGGAGVGAGWEEDLKFTFKSCPRIYFSYELDTTHFVWQKEHYTITDLSIPFEHLGLAQIDFDNLRRISSGGCEGMDPGRYQIFVHI
jgi:hypothetical protein